ncbi:uncharacterized protein LOC127737281 isoform X1 [Mytilus californianus]|uniref:uncharacterized protein LOC127737281 isoform X1 n=2 Tax=Mytilus californianus TaxID=6549 RepID=UPI00224562C9|nr:uncharacterized protein LOC127737281 isoform X1 [Mytilus californianus]
MECKTVPKRPETRIDLVTEVERKSGTWCSRFGLKCCFGIMLVIILIYCFYLHLNFATVQKQIKHLQTKWEDSEQPQTFVKRHLEDQNGRQSRSSLQQRRHNRRRNRRHNQELEEKLKDLSELPLVHLTAQQPESQLTPRLNQLRDACLDNQKCFLWSEPPSYFQWSFTYIRQESKIVGINITRAGYYEIYSQISVAGLKNEDILPVYPSFGYETIRVPDGDNPIALSRSYITQDERGQHYGNSDGSNSRPVDTLNQMGQFRLNCKDIILVRLVQDLNAMNIHFASDPQRTYFGVRLVRPKGIKDFSCY